MTSPYGRKALRYEERKIRKAPEGTRNNTAAQGSWKMGGLVAGGELDQDEAEDALVDAAVASGLPQHEALLTVRSCLARGMDHPRSASPPVTSRDEAVSLLDDYEHAVWEMPWPGESGTLCLAVLSVVVELARQAGGPRDVPLGVRRVAAASGIGVSRAAVALGLLQEQGYLRLTKRARHGHPHHYTLTRPQGDPT